MSERPDPSNAGNPDPLENHITGLEPGGGVPPGETPPAESSTAWQQQGHADEEKTSKGRQALWVTIIGIVVVLALLYFIGYIVGIVNLF
jgi:hypothetical protein